MADYTHWPSGLVIGDGRIAVGEPITQDLMTDYRDRDNWLYDRDPHVLTGTDPNDANDNPRDSVLDATRDYRDKMVTLFLIVAGGNKANIDRYLPGGADDHYMNTAAIENIDGLWQPSAGILASDGYVICSFYSSGGSAAYNDANGPRSKFPLIGVFGDAYVWVRSGDGALMMTYTTGAAVNDLRGIVWHAIVWTSEDQGAY